MEDIIRLLPDTVANQIAAGEVIQRPASVIKELIENSIDAGATEIEVVIKDAGRTLIQVIDNGKGMSDTDARMAFERHATSKIREAKDLYALHTMGFRGEALASIAAVAQIEMRTMGAEATIGTRLIINGSQVESQEPVVCKQGTNLMVKNLFYTVPARRKFLKKDSVELAALLKEFDRLALVNPSVNFTLYHNDQILHQLRGASMKQRICELFGKNLDKQLIPISTETSIVKIEGFIGLPANARKRNALQYFLINGRNMRHPAFHKVMMECYEQLLPPESQPNYFISFTVEPDTIDVNVHPTKNEIKFENEFGIAQILTAAVKESLGRHNAMPGIDFDMDDSPDIPVYRPTDAPAPELDIDPTYNPFHQETEGIESKGINQRDRSQSIPRSTNNPSIYDRDWDKLYEEFEKKMSLDMTELNGVESAINNQRKFSAPNEEEERGVVQRELPIETTETAHINTLQISNSYIIYPGRNGMMVVDQRRAHIRVLFDKFLSRMKNAGSSTQAVLFPEVIHLTAAQSGLLETISEELSKVGFDLSPLGDNAWSINGIPGIIGDANPAEVLESMLITAEESNLNGDLNSLIDKVALGMAKAVALKSGTKLNDQEINTLISELLMLPSPNYTPDGLKIIVQIDAEELHSRFK